MTYFGHFYAQLGPNLKRLFSVFIILGNQYRPQTITLGLEQGRERSGSQPEKPLKMTYFAHYQPCCIVPLLHCHHRHHHHHRHYHNRHHQNLVFFFIFNDNNVKFLVVFVVVDDDVFVG